ncbi:MAG TPA: hypothetical protein VJ044_11615 [Candidatus Hodarchaeales archaeon]|nr:hypothetical protein [Candidatus Hodarchaeales archaeon]
MSDKKRLIILTTCDSIEWKNGKLIYLGKEDILVSSEWKNGRPIFVPEEFSSLEKRLEHCEQELELIKRTMRQERSD